MSNSGLIKGFDSESLVIWIESRILIFRINEKKVEKDIKFDAPIIDLKLWNDQMVLMAEKELQIVDLDGKVIRKYALVRRPTSLQVLNDEAFVADRSGDVYKFNLANEENSQEDQSETPKIEPILGHCSNLLKIEVDNNYIYTGEQDEKVRISLRKHPFVIEKYLLGHSEFISDFKLTKENTVHYSTSGDGTCIKWKDGEVERQTEAKNDSIAHSLSISPDGTHLTFAVQRYINPLESDEVKTKIQNESDPNSILRFDANLGERNEIKMKQGDYPLASHWIHQKCAYWLIENETKMVRLSKFEDGKEEILKDFEIKSERDEEHFDKLRKIQPRSENYDEYLRRRKEGFKQTRNDNKAKRRKKENSEMITA